MNYKLRCSDRWVWMMSFASLLVGISMLLAVALLVIKEAFPIIANYDGLKIFIFGPWEPLGNPPIFGIFHSWVSSLMVTTLALAIAIPVGLAVAIFASEFAPEGIKKILQPCMELLAGIPSVVYGFFGYITLVPFFEKSLGMATGESVLAAGLILSVMALPYIASTATEALRNVPNSLREAAYAIGLTRWYVISRIVMRHALPGIFAAIVLGLARAIGEALAVLMLTGNSTTVPHSLTDRGQPITALIITELGEAGVNSEKYHALMSAGLLLMLITVVFNLVIYALKKKMLVHHG